MGAWIIGREREISAPKVDRLYNFQVENLESVDIKSFHMAFVTNDDRVTQVCGKHILDNDLSKVNTKDCGITAR